MSRAGLWFKALEEMGEEAAIEAGFLHWPYEHYKQYPHADYDGVAALVAFVKEVKPESNVTKIIPSIPSRKRPGFFVEWRSFLKYMLSLPLNGKKIIRQQKVEAYRKVPSKRAYAVFNIEETLLCEQIYKNKKISMNAWFIHCLARAMSPYVEKNNKPQIWMIPISLRDMDVDGYEASLISGFVDAHIHDIDDEAKIHAQLKKKILNGDAWGGYLGFSLSSILGKTALKFLIKNNFRLQMRMGVLTNLGKWGDVSLADQFPDNTMGFAPVVYENPIAATTVTWMGKSWISLKVHSSIDLSQTELDEVMSNWKKLILSSS